MLIGNYSNLNMNGMFGTGACGTNFLAGSGSNIFGSIWGNGGNFYNCCDGTYDYNGMLGYSLATTFGTIAMGVLGNVISKKQAQKAEQANQPSIDEQIKDTNNKIAEQAKKLGVETAAEAKAVTAETEKTTLNTTKDEIETVNTKNVKLSGELKSLNSQLNVQKEALKNLPADATAEQKQAIEDEIKKLTTEIGEKEEKYKQNEAKKAELTKAVEVAQEKYDAKVALIKEVNTEIAKLEQTKADLEVQKEKIAFDKTADKADGSWFTRNNHLNVDKNYDKSKLNNGDLQELVHRYIKAEDGSDEKMKYAKLLKELTETDITSAKGKTSQRDVVKNAQEYVKKHNNQQ